MCHGCAPLRGFDAGCCLKLVGIDAKAVHNSAANFNACCGGFGSRTGTHRLAIAQHLREALTAPQTHRPAPMLSMDAHHDVTATLPWKGVPAYADADTIGTAIARECRLSRVRPRSYE